MLTKEQINEAFDDSMEGPDECSTVNFEKMAEILNAILVDRKEQILIMSREDSEQLVTRYSAYERCISLMLLEQAAGGTGPAGESQP